MLPPVMSCLVVSQCWMASASRCPQVKLMPS